jgi:glutaredoxin-like protein NrdH
MITLYTKPHCVQCDATKRAIEARSLAFETVDLTEDSGAMEKVQALGYRQAPVIVVGDQSWSGFRPDLIAKLDQSSNPST